MIMATKTAAKTTTNTTPADLTAIWGEDVEVLAGVDLLDKSELIGVPFLLTGVKFTVNDRSIVIAWIEGERQDHTPFTFTDTSTGVKAQIEAHCQAKGISTDALDEWNNLRLVAPNGLRVSTYEVKDERGKTREARTYYLTTSGARA
jgi:hypothetical protein